MVQMLEVINFFLILQYFRFKMLRLGSLKCIVCKFDMFCSSELLRYHSETQYKTLTGGLLSLVVICVVVGGFASMVGDTLKREVITSSLVTKMQSNPPLANLHFSREEMLMFGIVIKSFDLSFQADLSNGPQYFSLQLNFLQMKSGALANRTKVPLEQCTRQHWNMMPQFETFYDNFGVKSWLCMPIGTVLPLQGSLPSSENSFAGIQVRPCQNSTFNNNCAPQEDIDSLFKLYQNFYLILNYINPVINPNQQDFISYYMQGTNYIIFSSSMGSEAWMHFSDYSITTDDSIWPYQHVTTVSGFIVEETIINHPYSVMDSGSLARIYLAKSQNSLVYKRQVQKISAVLSYIGGLVGAITAILFLIKSYTNTSLEVNIGLSLFEASQEQKDKKMQEETCEQNQENENFSFLGFVKLMLYRLLRFCGWIDSSDREQYLHECQMQALKQMDVELLLKRVIKLETCISHLFTEESLREIKEESAITIKNAKKMRLLLLKQDQNIDQTVQVQVQVLKNNEFLQQNIILKEESPSSSVKSMHKDISDKFRTLTLSQQCPRVLDLTSRVDVADKETSFVSILTNSKMCEKSEQAQRCKNRNKVQPQNWLPPIDRKGIPLFPIKK